MFLTFLDHHGLSICNVQPEHVVAYVEARALAGIGIANLTGSLDTIRLGAEHQLATSDRTPLTLPARRHLADLWGEGTFDPSRQAPIQRLGDIVSMSQGGTPRDDFLVALTYRAGLRPDELIAPNLAHLYLDDTRLILQLPETKTGTWQEVELANVANDPTGLWGTARTYLVHRGTKPGPLFLNKWGERLADPGTVLRSAAARVGVAEFSPYSLRRSLAVHLDLMGVPGRAIAQHLRHSPNTLTYLVYIDPMLAVLDRDEAAARWLEPTIIKREPIPLANVRAGTRSAPRNGFSNRSLSELLSGLDMSELTVPYELLNTSKSGMTQGRSTLARWQRWMCEAGKDWQAPSVVDVSLWAGSRLKQVSPQTVRADLGSLRVGWIADTKLNEFPGWKAAVDMVDGAYIAVEGTKKRKPKSRTAASNEVDATMEAAFDWVPARPVRWAIRVLAAHTEAARSVEVVSLAVDHAVVVVDGFDRRRVLGGGGPELFCPMAASQVLFERGACGVPKDVSRQAIVNAAAAYTEALRDAGAAIVVASCGARPSDVARMRRAAVTIQPGGLAISTAATKDAPIPGSSHHGDLRFASSNESTVDPVVWWRTWDAWWPPMPGKLLPRSVTDIAEVEGMTANQIADRVERAIASAGLEGLTSYGFRRAVAQNMHDAGHSDEAIAVRLGHHDPTEVGSYYTDTGQWHLDELNAVTDRGASMRLGVRR